MSVNMVKVRFVEVEGSPDDVMRVSALFSGASAPTEHEDASASSSPRIATSNGVVSEDLVLRVFKRRELRPNIKKLLKALQQAGQKGLTSEEIAGKLALETAQLAGVFGAFGRRVANTRGWPAGADIIESSRDEKGRRRYHLPAVVRSALDKLTL
jgi:hypothetical protein